ncbi:NAD-dependent epimerase/dehydratase family protein [uncultured Desulfobacter sp.]|uniref:NAD-dependent epimerase/dehydratase family protein n=1 Tax=uncultured Desulfobacter sp. TaxID=240139 RepID=UPI002AA6ADCA|nr:NAD-dependent epimerase/dehydratase family protein [uncultured Desulfobacter sp.]
MNTLVIGGNGFIGSHLVDFLLKKGHSVRVFDKLPERHRPPLKDVDYRLFSLGNTIELYESLMGIDIVYHLASSSVPSTSGIDTVADVENDLVQTLKTLDLVVKRGVSRFVYFSSGGAIYGNTKVSPIPESHPLKPISSYGIIKATIESYIYLYQRIHGLEPLVLRPSNPYGPRQGHFLAQGVISTFLRKLKGKEELIVIGNGCSTKDYIYITDMVEMCGELSFTDSTGEYNIGSGTGTSVNEIIHKIKEIILIDPKIKYLESQSYDVGNFILDISKVEKILGVRKFVPMETGIANVWQWLNHLVL